MGLDGETNPLHTPVTLLILSLMAVYRAARNSNGISLDKFCVTHPDVVRLRQRWRCVVAPFVHENIFMYATVLFVVWALRPYEVQVGSALYLRLWVVCLALSQLDCLAFMHFHRSPQYERLRAQRPWLPPPAAERRHYGMTPVVLGVLMYLGIQRNVGKDDPFSISLMGVDLSWYTTIALLVLGTRFSRDTKEGDVVILPLVVFRFSDGTIPGYWLACACVWVVVWICLGDGVPFPIRQRSKVTNQVTMHPTSGIRGIEPSMRGTEPQFHDIEAQLSAPGTTQERVFVSEENVRYILDYPVTCTVADHFPSFLKHWVPTDYREEDVDSDSNSDSNSESSSQSD